MILTCPSCGTQYVVKDGAIPPDGRQVRCAACKHSWHQEPDDGAVAEPGDTAEMEPRLEPDADRAPDAETGQFAAAEPMGDDEGATSETDESIVEATLIEPRSGPEAEQRAFEEASIDSGEAQPAEIAAEIPAGSTSDAELPAAAIERDAIVQEPAGDWQEPAAVAAQDDEFSPFAAVDDDEPRRRSPLTTILIVVIAVIALAALFWFLAPADLKSKLGIAAAGATPLALVTTHMDRQRLESGNELLTVTGRIINPTGKEQNVPPLQAQLKTRAGKIVYSWTIAPPARSLPAGASASFNSAEVNVPPGGDELTITLGTEAS